MKTRFKRSQIRLISFNVAVIAVLGIWAYTSTRKANDYEMAIQSSQQMALSELGEYVDNIYIDLNKGIYANSPEMLSTFSSSLWRNTTGAKSNLAQLSINGAMLENTYKFLSQVSDFTISLNKKIALEQTINDEQRDHLYSLLKYAKDLSDQIDKMRDGINDGKISISDKTTNLSLNKKDTQVKTLEQSFTSLEESLVDYPSLIYDGPFSDHVLNKTSKMLEDKAEISADDAKAAAAKFSGISADKLKKGADETGNLPCYTFYTENTTVSITKAGGCLSYMLSSDYVGKAKLKDEEAVSKALSYLNGIGYTDMSSSYFETVNGICTVNFAYKTDEVLCYPDLIKVSVSLGDGKILSVDTRNFLINHTVRTFPTEIISEEEAKSRLSPLLDVQSVQRVVIPTEETIERYCYEFNCKGKKDDQVLVYIDCEKGIERDILMLINTKNGTLTK